MTNAFTSSEHTNFFFDVNNGCFEEALDRYIDVLLIFLIHFFYHSFFWYRCDLWVCDLAPRFAQFFIKPLMSPDATLREIKAVDSGNMLFGNYDVKLLEILSTVKQLVWVSSFFLFSFSLIQRIKKIYCLMLGEWVRYHSFYFVLLVNLVGNTEFWKNFRTNLDLYHYSWFNIHYLMMCL